MTYPNASFITRVSTLPRIWFGGKICPPSKLGQGSAHPFGRHEPHADVAALIKQAHPKYLRPWQQGRSNVNETDRPTGIPLTRPEKVEHDKAIGSGSPGATAVRQHRETGAERRLLSRSWCEEKSWNEAGSKHVSPRTPALHRPDVLRDRAGEFQQYPVGERHDPDNIRRGRIAS